MKGFVWRTAILLLLPTLLALGTNLARPNPLEWVAGAPHEIYRDCPESNQKATSLDVAGVLKAPEQYLLLDARPKADFDKERLPASRSLPYDPLFPIPAAEARAVAQAAGSRAVLVVGEGETPRALADELASLGLKRIFYLNAADWRALQKPASQNAGGRP